MKARAILIATVLLVGCQSAINTGSQQQSGSLSEQTPQRDLSLAGASFTSEQNQDLWGFIRSNLQMNVPDNSRIREQKDFYLSKKSYLHNVLLRADPYLYWIVEQVEKRQMPMELVLLPIVESAFNPYAKSPANAAGIWQIIPGTARHYGLKQTRGYDGRLDVVASTQTALEILQRLNTLFEGDWLLTIAAYNSGEGRVLRAIKENAAQGKPVDYWSLSLPKETQLYVPRLLALSDIFRHSQRYGLQLPQTDTNRALVKIPLNAPVDVKQISQITGITEQKLKAFNAGTKGNIYGLSGPQYVMVPRKYAVSLQEALENGQFTPIPNALLANSLAAENQPVRQQRTYKVRNHDTLSTIAKRLGVKIKDLRHWNRLAGNLIKPGQTLLVQANSTPATTNRRTNRKRPTSITYKVRKGDSLYSIAKRHRVNIADLRRWNNNTSSHLKPGDLLTLYLKNAPAAPDS